MLRTVLLIALSLLALVPAPGTAIYGGSPADPGEYPFMVHIFQHGDPSDNTAETGGFVCAGFLVTPTIVLTAGHCTESVADTLPVVGPIVGGGPMDRPQALIGRADRGGEGGEVIDIVFMEKHPLWMVGPGFGANDIGVFQLAHASSYAPVRVAQPGEEPLYAPGTMATVIGWGWTPEDVLPDDLLEVEIPVHADLDCKLRPQYAALFIPEQQVCAGAPGQDSCGGDSGGPLLVKDGAEWVAVGIVSYGSQLECGDPDHPGVYVETAAFQDYIDSWR